LLPDNEILVTCFGSLRRRCRPVPSARLPGGGPAMTPVFHHARQDGDEDDRHDGHAEIALYKGEIAEKVADVDEQGHPNDRPGQAGGEKMEIGHAGDAGHERRKRPHDGHEPGQDDRLAAMALVEGVGL